MTSEPIASPSASIAPANNVLLIVDAESLLSRYPQPSLEPQNPTEIEEGFIFAISGKKTAQSRINDSIATFVASNGENFHIRGRTVSLLAEHSVVFYEMSVGDAGVLSPPELVVHTNLTVPAPDPENQTQPGSHTADDHYWHCTQLAAGVAACELKFMLINKSCEALGYFRWSVDVTLAE
ncbi:AidA/PixA family protein [Pseudomonas sp. PMCC200344]|uniref:AidA/PixA family protein n=1 Tax=Pseudomonas sp. PMCC200344 TaxID=3042028 RepID=UPI0024B36A94|nr:AidA/PixA family protein [Pseudomonas sp. PMCC200344]